MEEAEQGRTGPEFEWDEHKRLTNLRNHEIDFWDALEVFERDHLVLRSDRHGEERWTAIGLLADGIVAVAFTRRETGVRLISALRHTAMSDDNITRVSLRDRRRGRTNLEKLRTISDEEIEAAVAADADAAPLDLDWSKAEVVVPQRKRPISIRVDEDVLAYFKAQGPGYQRRINAVLRAYMTATIQPGQEGSPEAAALPDRR